MKRNLEYFILIATLIAVIVLGLLFQILGISERNAQRASSQEPEFPIQETGDRFIIKNVSEVPPEPLEVTPSGYAIPLLKSPKKLCQNDRIVLTEDVDRALFVDCRVIIGGDNIRISNSEFIRSPLIANGTSGGVFMNNIHHN